MEPTTSGAAERFRPRGLVLKLLCLALALCIWVLANGARPVQVNLTLPLRLVNLPPGSALTGPPPRQVCVTISAPRFLVPGLKRANRALVLDLADSAPAGPVLFTHLETRLRLPQEARVSRISPGRLELGLKAVPSPQGD